MDTLKYSPQLSARIANEFEKENFARLVPYLDNPIETDCGIFSVWEMRCAFDRIETKGNWKLPISAWIDPIDKEITQAAICFYTGDKDPSFTMDAHSGGLKVESVGYYGTEADG